MYILDNDGYLISNIQTEKADKHAAKEWGFKVGETYAQVCIN
jgi:hypothetical protein